MRTEKTSAQSYSCCCSPGKAPVAAAAGAFQPDMVRFPRRLIERGRFDEVRKATRDDCNLALPLGQLVLGKGAR